MTRIHIIAAGFLLAAMAAPVAGARGQAASLCGMRDDLAQSLKKDHGEAPVSWGLVGDKHLIEVFASPAGGFTILITRPDGLACVMVAGEHWQELPPKPSGGA